MTRTACEMCGSDPTFHVTEAHERQFCRELFLCDTHMRDAFGDYAAFSLARGDEHASVGAEVPFNPCLVVVNKNTELQQLYLEEAAGARRCVFAVGIFDANNLGWLMQSETSRRLTHQTMFAAVRVLGGEVREAAITDEAGGILRAELRLMHSGRILKVDSRASDAIALALVARAPILISERLLLVAGV